MAQTDAQKLDAGDLFPAMNLQLVDGNMLSFPSGLTSDYTIFLGYRGKWWSHCRRQLTAFQEKVTDFEERNVALIAASVDPIEDARETVTTLGLTYPVAYGLRHMEFAEQTGAFYEVRRSIIHATEFVIKADGTLLGAVYSTGPSGRYDVEAAMRVIDFDIQQSK